MIIPITLSLVGIIFVCYALLWSVFKMYLETLDRYEKEDNEERIAILKDELKSMRSKMRFMASLTIVLSISIPVILITTEL